MLVNLDQVLLPAKRGGYAIGLFNTCNMEEMRGVLAAAEETKMPVIIGTAEILLPYCPLENLIDLLIPAAKRASVPVVVHYDHGLTYERCEQALRGGFSSVMYDCSGDDYEENVRKLADMVRLAHLFGATVEGELGKIGGSEGSNEAEGVPESYYTDPLQAKDFVERTGVDALAVAVGTAHGAYKFKPKLDFERIRTIASLIPTPLVLHGGSGLSDQDFRKAISCGISKINIFTDLDTAAARAAGRSFADGKTALTKMMPDIVDGVRAEVVKKIRLFENK